jgi:hypothetical protein
VWHSVSITGLVGKRLLLAVLVAIPEDAQS